MKVQVSGTNMESGKCLRTYVEERMQDNVTKFFTHAINGVVAFTKDKRGMFKSSVKIEAGEGHHLHINADAEEADVYNAFDSSLQKLITQIKKTKEKTTDRHLQRQEKDKITA